MSLESPPDIPFPLVKELADLLAGAMEWGNLPEDLEQESHLALEDYKNRIALNG